MGKPRGKASRESYRSLDPREGKRDAGATARKVSARACPHSRRGLTPLGRLQKYPKIHVSTEEETSGSRPDASQGLRPQHRREWNPERPQSNSHGDWPFLMPQERVPEVPVVNREHLPEAIVRNPARDKVMRKEADICKACSDFRAPSGNS